jgi:hypothetical protein
MPLKAGLDFVIMAEESSPFLKERTKKLPRRSRKSFLLLFFKKEGLAFP